MKEWSFYFPDDGETREDAVPIITRRILDAQRAAIEAVEYDFDSRDGWEKGEREFNIIVISPDGDESEFIGWHEPSVEHRAKPIRK